MLKRICILAMVVIGLIPSTNLVAQTAEKPLTSWSVEQQGSVTFIGVHTSLLGTVNRNRWQFYLGPKFQLSQSDGLGNGTWGVTAGSRFITGHSANNKLHSFINIQTQFTFADGGCSQDCPFELQLINEGFFTLGYQYDLGSRFFLSGSTGIGYQVESVELQGFDNPQYFFDINGTITLGFGYKF